DTDHLSGGVGKSCAQTAGAGADLKHQIVAGQFGRANKQVDEIEVDEEALSKLVFGLNPMSGEQALDMRKCLTSFHVTKSSLQILHPLGHILADQVRFQIDAGPDGFETERRLRPSMRHP